jgi:hypothetical protein
MTILPRLEKNKGMVSSALGKALAQEVLEGETAILEEAVALLAHESKNVRAGAAKIVEQVAVKRPDLVVEHLPQLLPALDLPEPQTRWMAIHTLGLCAALNPDVAVKALPKAMQYLEQKSGACLWGATITYLGDVGALSAANAQEVFPLLEQALDAIPRQAKNVLEAFLRILDQTVEGTRARIAWHAETYADDERSSVRTIARRVRKRVQQVERDLATGQMHRQSRTDVA